MPPAVQLDLARLRKLGLRWELPQEPLDEESTWADMEAAGCAPAAIGAEIALVLARSGAKVALLARRADRLTELAGKIAADGLSRVYSEIELPVGPILAEIETAGMKVNSEALHEFSAFITKELESLRAKIFGIAGREFNIGSPKQVGEIFEELNDGDPTGAREAVALMAEAPTKATDSEVASLLSVALRSAKLIPSSTASPSIWEKAGECDASNASLR